MKHVPFETMMHSFVLFYSVVFFFVSMVCYVCFLMCLSFCTNIAGIVHVRVVGTIVCRFIFVMGWNLDGIVCLGIILK